MEIALMMIVPAIRMAASDGVRLGCWLRAEVLAWN